MTESDPFRVFLREWYMWAVQLVPSWRREIQKGARAQGMTRYRYERGLAFVGDLSGGGGGGRIGAGGLLLPQVYAREFGTGSGSQGKVWFTDDLIFSAEKKGLFQLLVLPDRVEEIELLTRDLDKTIDDDISAASLLLASETTVLVQSTTSASVSPSETGMVITRLATAAEFAADPVLCKNRPPPIGYDPLRIRKEVQGRKYVILRPDRFVFAACGTRAELREAVGMIRPALHLDEC